LYQKRAQSTIIGSWIRNGYERMTISSTSNHWLCFCFDMDYLAKNSDTIDGFTRIQGIQPDYKLCCLRNSNRRGTNRYYFDFYVYDESAGKLMRKVRWMSNGLRKEKALAQAKPMMRKIDELLILGYHLPNLNRIDRMSFCDAIEMYLSTKLDRISSQKDYKTAFITYLLPYAKEHWNGCIL